MRRMTARRSRWVLVPVAAAVALVAGTWFVASGSDTSHPAALSPGTASEGRASAEAPSGATPSQPPATTRTVRSRNVAVDVPATWPDRVDLPDLWCAVADPGSFVGRPYVALPEPPRPAVSYGCKLSEVPAGFPPIPRRLWQGHLEFRLAARGLVPDGVRTFHGWTLTAKTVGEVQVSLLTDGTTAPLAATIMSSARVVDVDAVGCDTTSPAQSSRFVPPRKPFDISRAEVDSILVCQYARTGTVGLIASRRIEGTAARDVVQAMRAAPPGGGPDTKPENCPDDEFGHEALALRLGGPDGVVGDVYVYYDWCVGNGFDDGTTRRELTRAACSPLFHDPVRIQAASKDVMFRCLAGDQQQRQAD